MNYSKPKRLPPHGREIANKLRRKEKINEPIKILAGSGGWEFSRNHKPGQRLILPFDSQPSDFWWPVKDCECVIYRLGDIPGEDDTVRELGYVLLKYKASKVTILNGNGVVTIFTQDNAA